MEVGSCGLSICYVWSVLWYRIIIVRVISGLLCMVSAWYRIIIVRVMIKHVLLYIYIYIYICISVLPLERGIRGIPPLLFRISPLL
jgi:hypothetical protein